MFKPDFLPQRDYIGLLRLCIVFCLLLYQVIIQHSAAVSDRILRAARENILFFTKEMRNIGTSNTRNNRLTIFQRNIVVFNLDVFLIFQFSQRFDCHFHISLRVMEFQRVRINLRANVFYALIMRHRRRVLC